MNLLMLINFVITFAIFLATTINFFKHYRKKKISKIINYFSIIGFFYVLISVLLFIWSVFDFITYAPNDFLLLYSLTILFQTLIIFKVIGILTDNKKLSYFLFLYFIALFSLYSALFSIYYLILLISFLLLLISFLSFSSSLPDYKKSANFGIFYSSVSTLLLVFVYFNIKLISIFSLISNFLFLLFVISFFKNLKEFPPETKEKKQRKENYALIFLKYFIFIIVLTNFVFLGTLSLHEFGHFSVSKIYNCDEIKIVYEGNLPYTELLCQNQDSAFLGILGGITLPIIIAIILFIIGGKFIKEISLLILGFNFILSYHDFTDLNFSDNLVFFSLILGVLFLVIGIVLLAKSRTEDYPIAGI